jgi:cytoskeleton protein RodZ
VRYETAQRTALDLAHETTMRADESAMSSPGEFAPGRSAVGTLLRATRQRHGLSIADVAQTLRIRAPYIEAIEDGRPADLPAPAYAVGFVKAYAKALALDEAEILRRFRAEAADLGRRTQLDFPAPVPERSVPAGAVAMVGILLAAGAYGGWWYLSGGSRPQEAVAPPPDRMVVVEPPPALRTPPPIVVPQPAAPGAAPAMAGSGALAGLPMIPPGPFDTAAVIPPIASPPPPSVPPPSISASSSPTAAQAAVPPAPVPAPGAPLPEGVFGAASNEESRVLVRARAETWIQVRDRSSGSVVFNRTLKPGEAYRAPNKPGLLLTMGNAPGTDVLMDGQLVTNPFPTVSVRRDIPLEPEKVKEGMATPVAAARAPSTPAAPGGQAGSGAGGFIWGAGGPTGASN